MRFIWAFPVLALTAVESHAEAGFSGYFDLSFAGERSAVYANGRGWGALNNTAVSNSVALQYRTGNCALGLMPQFSIAQSETMSFGSQNVSLAARLYGMSAGVGCQIDNTWLTLSGNYSDTQTEVAAYNLGSVQQGAIAAAADWWATPDTSIGLMAGYHFIDAGLLNIDGPMARAKLNFHIDQNWMVEAKVRWDDDFYLDDFGLTAAIFFKPDTWRSAFYGGIGARYIIPKGTLADNVPSDSSVVQTSVMVGMRFYFQDGSLREQQKNGLPVF